MRVLNQITLRFDYNSSRFLRDAERILKVFIIFCCWGFDNSFWGSFKSRLFTVDFRANGNVNREIRRRKALLKEKKKNAHYIEEILLLLLLHWRRRRRWRRWVPPSEDERCYLGRSNFHLVRKFLFHQEETNRI